MWLQPLRTALFQIEPRSIASRGANLSFAQGRGFFCPALLCTLEEIDPLYNQRGAVYAWLHGNGNIYGLAGEALAFVDDDGVYNWEGVQIG